MQTINNKNDQIQELFKSRQLVFYPADTDQYQMVNPNELLGIQELDKEDSMNDFEDRQFDKDRFTHVNSFDLTASRFDAGGQMLQTDDPDNQFKFPILDNSKDVQAKAEVDSPAAKFDNQDDDGFEDLVDEAKALQLAE